MSALMSLPPQDLDAELSVLGGILLANDALFEVTEHINPEDFYRPQHRLVYEAMLGLAERSEPIDLVTLADELRRRDTLKDAGGAEFLGTLDVLVPATANIARYAKIVRDKAALRRLVEVATIIRSEALSGRVDAQEILDKAGQRILDAMHSRPTGGLEQVGAIVRRVFADLEKRYERQKEVTGIPTGFADLDRMTSGFHPGQLIIAAARPAMGKTSWVLNVASHVATEGLRQETPWGPVAFFEQEMDKDSLVERLLSSEGRVDGTSINNGLFADTDWPKLARASDRLFKTRLFLDDTPGLTVMDIRGRCRKLAARYGQLGLVVIDYLQLLKGSGNTDNRTQEVGEISGGLKLLARELRCPVIALAQLNRELEKRADKRPQMSDLRDSGAVEQDADTILFFYRDDVYNPGSNDKGIAEIIIGKQRKGPIGTVRVAFHGKYTRFENLAEGNR